MDTWDRRWWWNPTVVHYIYSIWCHGFSLIQGNDNTLQCLLSGAWTGHLSRLDDNCLSASSMPSLHFSICRPKESMTRGKTVDLLTMFNYFRKVSQSCILVCFYTMEYFTYCAFSLLKIKKKISLIQTWQKQADHWNCTRGKILAEGEITMSFP